MLGVLVCILLMAYLYYRYSHTYWTRKGVPMVQTYLLLRFIGKVVFRRTSAAEGFADIYRNLEGRSFAGAVAVSNPLLIVREPELIKDIMVKNFRNFQDHGVHCDEKGDPLCASLFFLNGERWKRLRAKLTPAFAPGKLKMIFPIVKNGTQELLQFLEEPANKSSVVDIKETLAKYTTNIIASYAFGVECNCLKYPDAEFRKWGKKIFEPSLKSGVRDLLMFVAPSVCSMMKIPFVPKDVERFFCNVVRETINYRETNDIQRNDFMQLLMQLKAKDGKEGLSFLEITAQAFVFFIAGFETSSITMTFCLYELALNPEVQERLRHEVDTVTKNHGNQLTYEAIRDMEYLERVIKESLRKYPPIPILMRQCTEPYCILGTNIKLDKGVTVAFPVFGMHYDAKYFPEPHKFDPDRFSTEAREQQHSFTFLPFGEGPRGCIGMQFAMQQMKVAIASLVSHYAFEICDESPVPVILDPRSIMLAPLGGMKLKILRRPEEDIMQNIS